MSSFSEEAIDVEHPLIYPNFMESTVVPGNYPQIEEDSEGLDEIDLGKLGHPIIVGRIKRLILTK